MNKQLKSAVTGAIITAGIAMAAPANAASIGEQYVSASLAIADVSTHSGLDDGLTFVGTYGLGLPMVHKYFGIEAEFSKSVIDPEYDYVGYHADFDYFTLAGYALFTVPVHERISVRGRAGMLYENWEYSDNNPATRDYSDSDIGISIGGGAIYKFQPNMNFVADVTIIESDIVHVSAGAQFKF